MSFWDEIDERDYLPFAKFETNGKYTELFCQIIDEEPSIFKNRWGKEQWSIRIWKFIPQAKGQPTLDKSEAEDDMYLLVGGVRLFRELKKNKDYDGILRIRRLGEGFKTNYKVIQKIPIK